jgi:mannose-6-phosphate isomerase-like protein (cupin superfamily)
MSRRPNVAGKSVSGRYTAPKPSPLVSAPSTQALAGIIPGSAPRYHWPNYRFYTAAVKLLRLDEIAGIPVFGTLVWKPIRKTLGVTAFGINAYTAANAGDEVVEEHTEQQLGHEEIYAVISGHATFTVNGEEVDAPAGTLVYLDDVTERRHAVAREPGTTVLAIGGVPGTHEVSAWEYFFPALEPMREGDYATARQILEEGLAEKEVPVMHYQLACLEALAGNSERALDELQIAADGSENLRTSAQTDEDFASIRNDPRFPQG